MTRLIFQMQISSLFKESFGCRNVLLMHYQKFQNPIGLLHDSLNISNKNILMNVVDLSKKTFENIKMIWAADPCKLFTRYVKNLQDSTWGNKIPNPLQIVLSGDKGSDTTKFGLFVPTDVSNSQSPYNFLLLSMYQGPETRVLIEKATAFFFEFINSILEAEGLEMDVGNGSECIAIKVLFVGDLKMLPFVFWSWSFVFNNILSAVLSEKKWSQKRSLFRTGAPTQWTNLIKHSIV